MKFQMKVTAFHMVDNLATGLYESVGQRLMELVRNSVVASMANPNVWEPKRAKIELSLVPNHPLSPSKSPALVVLGPRLRPDRSSARALLQLARHTAEPAPQSRERIVRRRIPEGHRPTGGARSQRELPARRCHDPHQERLLPAHPHVEDGQRPLRARHPREGRDGAGLRHRALHLSDIHRNGLLKNLQGPFTAIVIPTPIFKSHAEIYEAIKWLLPREQDKMFDLTIGGKAMQPPPLEKEINLSSTDGRYRARLAAGNTDSDGIWLCDDETGFRVASCQKLGRLLPDPLWYPDLVGDIFAPGLLRHQNTARSTLAKEFTRKGNKEWQRLLMFLIRDVASQAKQLIERDSINGSAAETLDELAELFNERFGLIIDDGDKGGEPRKPRDPKPAEPGGKDDGGEKGEPDPERQYRRHIAIRVRDEVFYLYRGQTLHPYVFAQVSPNNPKMIFVNVRGGYKALPDQKVARREHCFVQVLMAIGASKFPSDRYQAMMFANEVRGEFLK